MRCHTFADIEKQNPIFIVLNSKLKNAYHSLPINYVAKTYSLHVSVLNMTCSINNVC